MSQNQPLDRKSIRKASGSPELSRDDFPPAPAAESVDRLLNLSEVQGEYGLSIYAIYGAVQRGQLHALRRDGKGRTYYAEWEVVKLLRELCALVRAA